MENLFAHQDMILFVSLIAAGILFVSVYAYFIVKKSKSKIEEVQKNVENFNEVIKELGDNKITLQNSIHELISEEITIKNSIVDNQNILKDLEKNRETIAKRCDEEKKIQRTA